MLSKLKLHKVLLPLIVIFFANTTLAEEEEIYLKAISDQIQVITKDLKSISPDKN